MLKVAMLSFWHVHAKDYARMANQHPDTEIVAIWDEDAERGRSKAEEYGVRFYDNMQELLDNAEIDAVIVDTPTSMHRDVIIAAASAGKHVLPKRLLLPQRRNARK